MTREEYLAALRRELRTLPESDITDICGDFEEHFAIGLSQGKTEHEISAELGDPTTVAATYFDENLEDIGHTMKESAAAHAAAASAASASAASAAANRPAAVNSGTSGTSGAGAAGTGTANSGTAGTAQNKPAEKDVSGARLFVILLNVLLTWWVALSVFGMLISFWGISISLMAGGIGALAAIVAAASEWTVVLVLSGIAAILMAIATGILNFFLTKWTVIGCRAYVKWNKKLCSEGF